MQMVWESSWLAWKSGGIAGRLCFLFFHPEELYAAMLQGILFIQCSCCMNFFYLRLALWFALTYIF